MQRKPIGRIVDASAEAAHADFDLQWIGRSTGRGERRQVVVLAVGFERMAAADPEEIVEILARRREVVARIVARYGGSVGRVDPELQIIAWGWPVAGEADTRLAVATALEIAREHAHPARCGVDVGIAITAETQDGFTGLGFVGDMVAAAVAQQSAAGAGEVLVSDAVCRLVTGAFDMMRCDGTSAPAALWRAARIDATARRRTPKLAAPRELLGRDRERGVLVEAWRGAVAGEPKLLVIEGEAGIGKSAMICWLERLASGTGGFVVLVKCSPEYRHLPLQPVHGLVDLLARLHAPVRGARLGAGPLLDPAPFEGDIEGQRLTERCRAVLGRQGLDRQELAQAILALVEYKAAARPIVIAIENLQWADAASLDVISQIGAHADRGLRLLVAGTLRSGTGIDPQASLTGPWRRLPLERLERHEIERIIATSGNADRLGPDVVAWIVELAAGNPFHATELTRMSVETAGKEPHGRMLARPNRLNSELAGRLDALASLKPLVQAAAVLGRLFDSRALAAALEMDVRVLDERLAMLVGMGILARRRRRDAYHYRFQDALLWSQAYGSVLRARRRALHLKIAALLSGPFGAGLEVTAERVAHHWKKGGDAARSFPWWLDAAIAAAEQGSAVGAVACVNEALAAKQLAPEACSPLQEATLMSMLGAQLRALRGSGSSETVAAYERALGIISSMPSRPADIDLEIAWGLATIHLVRGDVQSAAEASSKLMSDAAERGREDIELLAQRVHGTARLLSGSVLEAVATFADIVARYDHGRHGEIHHKFVSDPGAVALAHLASARSAAGDRDGALSAQHDALELAGDIGHSHTMVNVMGVLSLAAMHRGDHGEAMTLARACERISHAHGHAYWHARARLMLAWHAGQRDPARGVELIAAEADRYRSMGAGRATAFQACLAAETAIRAGLPQRALELLAPVKRRGEQRGEWLYIPDVKRLEAHAAALLSPDRRQGALALLDEAAAMSSEHGSTAFAARIAATRAVVDELGERRGRASRRKAKASFTPARTMNDASSRAK